MKRLVYVVVLGCLVPATIPMVVAIAQEAPSAEDPVEKMVVSSGTDNGDFVRQTPESAKVITWTPSSGGKTIGQFRAARDGSVVYPAQGGRRPTLRIVEPDDGQRVDGRFTVRVEGPRHAEFGWSTMQSRRGSPALAGDGMGRIGADGKWSTILDIGDWDTLQFNCTMRVRGGEAVGDQITVHSRMLSPPRRLTILEPEDGALIDERFTLRVGGPPRADITYRLRWPIPAGMVGGMSAPMRARLGADGTYTDSLRMDGRAQLTISCALTGAPGPADEVTVYSRTTPPGPTLRITEPDDGARVDGRFTIRLEGLPHAEFGWSTMQSRRGSPALAGDGIGRMDADGRWSTVLGMGDWDTLKFSCSMRGPGSEAVSDQITVHRGMSSCPRKGTPEPGNGARFDQVLPAAGPHVLDLNRRIAEAQRDLWHLKQQGAESQAIAAKRDEVLQCRYELARLLTDSPAGANVAVMPGGPAPPSRRGQAGLAPCAAMVGPSPRPPVYRLEAGYRPSAPPAPAAPPWRGSAGLAPPPPVVALQQGPCVYRIEVNYVPTSAVTQPHRRPCVRAVPRRVEQSQQQSQSCGQQQQGRGGQQQQQQMGRSQQQQQQQ